MKTIPLTQGKVALVDDEDFEKINKHKWYARRTPHIFYAARRGVSASKKPILMHREIMEIDNRNVFIDHRDYNGLNNQKNNFRICSITQNTRYRRKHKKATSIYKGVSFVKKRERWQVFIKVDRKSIFLGLFKDEQQAALAYNMAALQYHGDFASVNYIQGQTDAFGDI